MKVSLILLAIIVGVVSVPLVASADYKYANFANGGRSLSADYHNASSTPRVISVATYGIAGGLLLGGVGQTVGVYDLLNGCSQVADSLACSITIIVPAGYYYSFGNTDPGAAIAFWTEWQDIPSTTNCSIVGSNASGTIGCMASATTTNTFLVASIGFNAVLIFLLSLVIGLWMWRLFMR